MQRGIWYGLFAYVTWGLLPVYWKALGGIPAQEILANRVVWSLVLALILLVVRRNWSWLRQVRRRDVFVAVRRRSRVAGRQLVYYIWAVNAGHVVETSLGYFINPLVNVVLGVLIFRETLRPLRWGAVKASPRWASSISQ
ncbi:MAG: EamA family transporter [Caldilineaceae bacterium]